MKRITAAAAATPARPKGRPSPRSGPVMKEGRAMQQTRLLSARACLARPRARQYGFLVSSLTPAADG